MKRSSVGILSIAGLIFAVAAMNAGAATLPFGLDTQYGGSASPSGSKPWLGATFTDRDPIDLGGGLRINVVELSLNARNLTAGEFVDSWYFNINPNYNLPLTITYQQPPTSSGPNGMFARNPNSLDANGANGEGQGFDLGFDFYTEGTTTDVFGAGEAVSFLIQGVDIFSSSFNFLNTRELFFTAALIRGIGPNSASAWVADAKDTGPGPAPIPEPATMILFGLGAGAMALFGKKKFRKP